MPARNREAFTQVELLITILATGLISTLALSVIANGANRNDSAVCANNLRQVGRAFHMWASDHGGENPWVVSWRDGGLYVSATEERPNAIHVPGVGSQPAGVRNNTWVQFAFAAQELKAPSVLICPTDRAKLRAQEFSGNAGYLSLDFRDRATSYFIGLHSFRVFPNSILSGDRSLKESAVNQGCSLNLSIWYLSRIGPSGWQPGLHALGGNLLLNDGRVEGLSDEGLARFLTLTATNEPPSIHMLKPN